MNNSPDQNFFQEDEQESFNFKEVLFKYLSYWKWFLISFSIALTCSYVYLRYQTPIYKIATSILIKDQKKGMGTEDMLKQLDMFSSNKVVDNEIEILKSYSLMEKVVTDLNLNIHYIKKGKIRDIELYDQSPVIVNLIEPSDLTFNSILQIVIDDEKNITLNGVVYSLDKINVTPYGILKFNLSNKSPKLKSVQVKIDPITNTALSIIGGLSVEATSKMSSVLNLSMENPVPQKGIDILNYLISVYDRAALEDKNKVASKTLVFVEERLKLLSTELIAVETNVEDYKSKERIVNLSAEAQLFLESVQKNDRELDELKIQRSIFENVRKLLKNNEFSQEMVTATVGVSDPTLNELIKKLADLQIQKERQKRFVKSDNPIILTLDDQIRNLKNNINENVENLTQNLNLTSIQLENQNNRLESMIKTIPTKERTLLTISREQAIKSNLFTYLLQKREESALSFASEVADSRTIDKARSSGPVKPVSRNIYILFSLIGLAIPFLTIYLIDLFNDKIKRRKDIEKATQLPILGEISLSDSDDAIVIDGTSRSMISEQIRGLRTNLSFLSIGKDIQNILFTSSMSGEGKSFVSLNLGASLALTGKKVIILEFDMRKPKLRLALKMEESNGLSNYLVGRVEINEIIRPVPNFENYFIVGCGPIPPNPVELLLNGRLEELFKELRSQFDHIIIDAPPVGLVTDAQVIEKHADATMFVVRHNYTPLKSLKPLDLLYKERKFKNLNLVFNGIQVVGKYGYGYGYGYYVEGGKGKQGKKNKNKKV